MKNSISEHHTLALVLCGIATLIVGSLVIASLLVFHTKVTPKHIVTTETSGCATPLTPKEKILYVLSRSLSNRTFYISAVNTNGRQRWMQKFATLAVTTRGSLEETNGTVYVFATGYIPKYIKQGGRTVEGIGHIINIAAAYNANNGKKRWDIMTPNNSSINGMSICNNTIYLWTESSIYAYNWKNGRLLWKSSEFTLLNTPRIVVTNNAIVFTSKGQDTNNDSIYALNAKKGTLLWKVNIPNRDHNTQSIAITLTATNKAVYVSQFSKASPEQVEALSISNGKLLWKASVHMPIENTTIRFPFTIVGNNILYLYTSNAGLVALNVKNGTHLWQGNNISQIQSVQDRLYVTYIKVPNFCQLDPVTGKSQWCISLSHTGNPIEAVSDHKTLYIASSTGVSALQKKNGKVSWTYKGNKPRMASILPYSLSLAY
jgi:outer membrane protein assembly factor BamB